LDVFKDPVILGCSHTFCRMCALALMEFYRPLEGIVPKDTTTTSTLSTTPGFSLTSSTPSTDKKENDKEKDKAKDDAPSITCPVCRAKHELKKGEESLISNRTLKNLLEHQSKDRKEPCGRCGKDSVVDCEKCECGYCEECKVSQHTFGPFKLHAFKPVGTLSSQKKDNRSRNCAEHKKELELHCNTCRKLVCDFCTRYGTHKSHVIVLLSEAMSEVDDIKAQKRRLQDILEQLEKLQDLTKKSMETSILARKAAELKAEEEYKSLFELLKERKDENLKLIADQEARVKRQSQGIESLEKRIRSTLNLEKEAKSDSFKMLDFSSRMKQLSEDLYNINIGIAGSWIYVPVPSIPAGTIELGPLLGELTHPRHKEYAALENWLKKPFTQWKLLYRWTVDRTSSIFHQKCDNKGPTVSVCRMATGAIFGGYAAKAWSSDGQYHDAPGSFLFSLTDGKGRPPYQCVNHQNNTHCVYHNASYGPTFGGNHDLYFALDSPTSSYSNVSYSYQLPTGFSNPQQFLAGSYNSWTWQEVEVYAV